MSSTLKNVQCRNPIDKSMRNPRSLRLAINAKCYECLGGSSRDQNTQRSVLRGIRECSAYWCPIYPVRGGLET